ncbi:hypothetical protein ACJMK2_026427 [Sinanodonta woodiana]|uniref:Peptidase S1 domain-containing protein n=1 Tax=Sinanodonta woodiana TaxID=1069815 RepID=A0ABD3XN89_SINWO
MAGISGSVLILLLLHFRSFGTASECSTYHHGTCQSFVSGHCPAGSTYSYQYCSVQEYCCIPPGQVTATTHPTQHSFTTHPTQHPDTPRPTHTAAGSIGDCSQYYHGTCQTFQSGHCPAGSTYSYSHCGFMEYCCIPPGQGTATTHPTQHPYTTHPTHTGTGSSGGHCGISDVGKTATKIVGGTVATHGEYPWQVALMYNGFLVCGGTLIGDRWVATAAHCFEDAMTASYWTVGVGLQDRRQIYSTNIYHVTNIFVHESYVHDTEHNDIALIRLSKPVDLSNRYTRAACLPPRNANYESQVCTVSGWGATYYDKDGKAPTTQVLYSVDLQVISNNLCLYYLGNVIYDSNICAGATASGGRDTCQGDSGGPMVCKMNGVWELAGIVSWGYGCGDRYKPGVYTRVSSYLDWIHLKMQTHP